MILTNNFVRGAVSGLGIVNVLAAVAELAEMFAGRERRARVHDDAESAATAIPPDR